MKDRLVTLALAIAAVAACYVFLFPKPASVGSQVSVALSTDGGPHGYLAAWRWLRSSNIPATVLRHRYDHLSAAELSASASGNVLLTTMPYRLPSSRTEEAPLNAWIERGNTLVVMAALDDTPDWALTGGKAMEQMLERVMHLKLTSLPERGAAPSAPPSAATSAPPSTTSPAQSPSTPGVAPGDAARSPTLRERLRRLVTGVSANTAMKLSPTGRHPLMNGVGSIAAFSEFPADRWTATPTDAAVVFGIAGIDPAGESAVWLKRQGSGQVVLIGVASAFSNRAIGEADNAQFLANIVAWCRSAQGTVIFDDAHQGAVGYYDPKAFFADPRLHRTILWVLVIWFVFVLGAQVFRVQEARWRPVDVTAFIGASGEFFAGILAPSAAAERLLSNFFNSLRRRLALREDGLPVWHWLERQAAVSAEELAELRRQYARATAGQRVDLVRLQNLLSRLQGALL
ncbi:MAG TPA: DUF4350 domain-containing protein [Steroidobacteraceae bacterium]|nr:DUF4350 domain-containing protein [Steroidobacteraceae bacterium]